MAQETGGEREALNRFPRMMQEYCVRRVREMDGRRREVISGLRTRGDAEAYVESVRRRIRMAFGPMPEKTPLNARVTGVLERDGYRVEKVIFESRPGFLVTANLYVPGEGSGRRYPLPGVVGTCGHSSNGKAEGAYQGFAQGLARQGYVVLIYDPIGQGERLQYPDGRGGSRVGVGVREHLMAGNQQFLVGEFIGTWRAWDGIRALDYLLSRPEVDPRHVGVTGNSGGGTMTTWLCGLEPRFTMGAPSCFVTSFLRNLENELPADTEQCPPRALALGLDHEDFLAAFAPRPVIILAKEKDYFDVRGSEAAFERLKRVYGLLGAEDEVALFVGPTGHGFSRENREAMYGWFHRATGNEREASEPELVMEKDEDLWCASGGQVAREGSRTVMDFTRWAAEEAAGRRGRPDGNELREEVKRTLRVEVPDGVPDYRILPERRGRGYPEPYFTGYAVATEPGVHAIVYLLGTERHASRPPKGRGRAVLYVSDRSSDSELRGDAWVRRLAEEAAASGAAFYSCDVRGTGESQPDTCGEGSFLQPYGSDYFYSAHGLMLDDPYPGQKARDVVRVLRWLRAQGHERVDVAASGRGAIPAALGVLMSGEGVGRVLLKGALSSYQSLAETETHEWPLSALVPSVLGRWDLPDVYREIGAEPAG